MDSVIYYTLAVAMIMVFNNMAWMVYVVKLWERIDEQVEELDLFDSLFRGSPARSGKDRLGWIGKEDE